MSNSTQKTTGRIGERIAFKNQEMINTLFDSTFNWAAGTSFRDNNRNGRGVSGTTLVTDGNWHHIAAVRDYNLNTNYIYVDGQLGGQFTFDFTNGFGAVNIPVNVGYLNLSPYYYYTGDLDELAVYSSALSADTIQMHYQNGLNGKNYCQQ